MKEHDDMTKKRLKALLVIPVCVILCAAACAQFLYDIGMLMWGLLDASESVSPQTIGVVLARALLLGLLPASVLIYVLRKNLKGIRQPTTN